MSVFCAQKTEIQYTISSVAENQTIFFVSGETIHSAVEPVCERGLIRTRCQDLPQQSGTLPVSHYRCDGKFSVNVFPLMIFC